MLVVRRHETIADLHTIGADRDRAAHAPIAHDRCERERREELAVGELDHEGKAAVDRVVGIRAHLDVAGDEVGGADAFGEPRQGRGPRCDVAGFECGLGPEDDVPGIVDRGGEQRVTRLLLLGLGPVDGIERDDTARPSAYVSA